MAIALIYIFIYLFIDLYLYLKDYLLAQKHESLFFGPPCILK